MCIRDSFRRLTYTATAAINRPLSLLRADGFVATIPREIDEASVIDGCKRWQLFLKVIAPLLKPIVSTLFVPVSYTHLDVYKRQASDHGIV